MKLAKRLTELAIERSLPTPERLALTAQEAAESVVCSCGSIDRRMRGHWIKLIRPRVERALKNKKHKEQKRARQVGINRMREPGYQFRLPF